MDVAKRTIMTLSREYQVIKPSLIRNRLYRRWMMKLYGTPEWWKKEDGYRALPLPQCIITLIRAMFPTPANKTNLTASYWLKVCDKECPKLVPLYHKKSTWRYLVQPRTRNNNVPEHLSDGNESDDSKYFLPPDSDGDMSEN
jgi:hypothetical protein